MEISFDSVFQLAKQAAEKAFQEAQATPVVFGQPSTPFGNDVDLSKPHSIGFMCGFAWVNIYADRRKPEGKALKAAGVRWDDYRKAFSVSSYDLGCHGQSVELKSAGCQAAAEVFQRYGYRAYAEDRLD
jgi:hypothetical protein